MSDMGSLINEIPPVTRTILAGVLAVTTPCLLAFISPRDVALLWFRIPKGLEIWRPITAFFYGGGGFPLIFDFFCIYRNSTALEKNTYLGNTAEYAWVHVILAILIMLLNIPWSFPFLFRPLLHAQTYLWCRANPTLKVSLFGLLTLPTGLYPFALLVLDLVTGGPGKALNGSLGLLAGHAWWFFSVYLPVYAPAHIRRANPLRTPAFFKAFFSNAVATATSTTWGGTRFAPQRTAEAAKAGSRNAAADAVRHRWGGGQKLGGEPL